MAAITATFDFSKFPFIRKLPDDAIRDKVLTQVAGNVIFLMRDRIHEQGRRADGSAIGTYADSYKYTRKKNNMEGDNVIFVLTGKLQQGWTAVPTQNGYGVGYLYTDLYKLVQLYRTDAALLAKFGKVFDLSDEERDVAVQTAKDLYIEELKKLI